MVDHETRNEIAANIEKQAAIHRRLRCAVCGFQRDKAIHLPPYGAPVGAEPWGHPYQPIQTSVREPMSEPTILRPAIPAVTLDDALLSMSTFPNGCDFRLRFEGRRVFLEWGCYGVHINLVQGARRVLTEWLQEAGRGDRELLPAQIQPETLIELKSRKPCQQCGGFRFKDET